LSRGTVVVTGSSSGIGRACALHLDELGFEVLAGVRRESDGESLRVEAGGALEPVMLDVTDSEAIASLATRVSERGVGLAGLVNNAGVGAGGPLEHLPVEEFRRVLDVNVTAQVAVTQALLPELRRARGRVVFMGSIGGRMALPYMSPYNASKFALEAIADSLRQELRPLGVQVSIVEPGSIDTLIWAKGAESSAALRERVDPAADRVYGERFDRFTEAARKTGERGIPPRRVAEAVAHALTASRPRTRYLVGADAKLQAGIRRVVPDRLRDRLVDLMARV
jgi:NAD(P)-dependent dehydrogenase (short-subunit alcohol dehydrogenase family)